MNAALEKGGATVTPVALYRVGNAAAFEPLRARCGRCWMRGMRKSAPYISIQLRNLSKVRGGGFGASRCGCSGAEEAGCGCVRLAGHAAALEEQGVEAAGDIIRRPPKSVGAGCESGRSSRRRTVVAASGLRMLVKLIQWFRPASTGSGSSLGSPLWASQFGQVQLGQVRRPYCFGGKAG